MSDDDYVYRDVRRIKKETNKAFLMEFVNGDSHWVPKSQLADPDHYEEGDEDLEDVAIAEWWAEQEGV